ncbi:PDZ domain-containing protein [Stenotrophomonas sp.]|uniref:PDZ domain-containing protein n=1 Tax=Stenotrophomonas sp. TaxID=69392 RepID=UPI0028AB1481|nr:PDZ domain-containing protein [Stenotrophomonas sp.]
MIPSRIRLALAVMLLVSTTACAESTRSESSRMDWRQDGARLTIESAQGVVSITAASPASRFGVQAGDQVLRVDGVAVQKVGALTDALGASDKATVPVTVRRAGRDQVLSVPTAAWRALRPPPAPRPPSPPSPPDRP